MSSKSISPTANLIRKSRLMSVPPPMNYTLAESHFYRTPYPTHQAITTPESSRSRGDWGLKREIPRKVNNKYIRYNNIDTMEHQTTFESSHDTVMTIKKWQEMDIPLGLRTGTSEFVSAFQVDSRTSQSSDGDISKKSSRVDWGYRDKFVQHMTKGELRTYIAKKIVPRRQEFEIFLQDYRESLLGINQAKESATPISEEVLESDPAKQDPKIEPTSATTQSLGTIKDINPSLLSSHSVGPQEATNQILLKAARNDPLKAGNIINEFLQIPLRGVPLRSHPSGGLHYILDRSYLENHHELGPNPLRQMPMRLINKYAGTTPTGGSKLKTLYIVGGIVQMGTQDSSFESSYRVSRVIQVTPMSAVFDRQGRVNIELDRIFSAYNYEGLIRSSRNNARLREENRQKDLEKLKRESALRMQQSDEEDGQLRDFRGKPAPSSAGLQDRLLVLIDSLKRDDNGKSR